MSRVAKMATPLRRKQLLFSTSRKRGAAKFIKTPLETPDRFIPSRVRMDTARCRASLLKASQDVVAEDSHYNCQLRRALFGTCEENQPMMKFGQVKRPRLAPTKLFVESHNPYRQDTLRSTAYAEDDDDHNDEQQRQSRLGQRRRPQSITMDRIRLLGAPDLLHNKNLSLMSHGGDDQLAIALGSYVYLWKRGEITLLAQDQGYLFSCVCWSDDDKLVALGTEGGVVVFCPERSTTKPLFELLDEHSGHVTAIAWNGSEGLAVACQNGITRYDLQKEEDKRHQATYKGPVEEGQVSSLQWSGNIIASIRAGTDSIKLWDANKTGRDIPAKRTMKHPKVQSIEVNPRQPNMIVSAGAGGLKFWNMWFGRLRSEITIDDSATITKTLCSAKRNEILVVHDNSLSVWCLSKAEKIMEYSTEVEGDITGLVRGPDGTIVCSHDNEMISFHSVQREMTKEKAREAVTFLTMPTLR